MKRIIILLLVFVMLIPYFGTDVSAATNKLTYGTDFSYITTGGNLTNVGNWFDGDSETNTYMSPLKDNYFVLQFKYPTDIETISFTSAYNKDWAMVKEFELGYYNVTHKYNTTLSYPEPVFSGVKYTANKNKYKQTFDVSEDIGMGKVTHLIFKINDVHMFSTGATWGGFYEFEISGIPDTTSRPVSEIIKKKPVVSNVDLLDEWGLLREDYVKEKTPIRMIAVDLLLHLVGEYEAAQRYVGSANYLDARDMPCAMNKMSYVYANKLFGIEGDGNGNFRPREAITAKEFYKMILDVLGYECGVDYTWDTMHEFVRGLGEDGFMGDMLFTDPFTLRDMCNVVWEALNTKAKGSDALFAQQLYNEGKMPERIWEMFINKFDSQAVVVSRAEYIPDATANRSGDFAFYTDDSPQLVTDNHFMYNACFHYSGVYYGTLPKDNPENQREAFAEALDTIGAKTLRWPGGNTVHWYFMEDNAEQHAAKLFRDAKAFTNTGGGFYDPDDPDDSYYTKFYDFLDFCKEYDIDTLLQVNPAYYLDEGDPDDPSDDKVRSVVLSTLNTKANADGSRYTIPGYYDRNRIEEGAEDLRKNLQEMKRRGYECYMWEIGNEDHWKDYDGGEYGDNRFVQDMFDLYVAYATVIKEEFPGSKVIIDTFDVSKAISAGIITEEDAKLFDAITDHYPFARWSSPSSSAERTNAWQFVANNDHMIEQAWINRQELDWGVSERVITESTAYRFQNWSSSNVNHSFAHALVLGHNWGQAVFDTEWKLACLHDLESPWFGSLLHNVRFNTEYRYFVRENEKFTNILEDDIPNNYRFKDSYYTTSAGRAFELLGRHSGGAAFETTVSNMNRCVSAFSTINGDEITLTIVNSLNETRPVTVKYTDMAVPTQTVYATELRTKDIFAVMPEDYIMTDNTEVLICGNESDLSQNAIEMEVIPFSITHFTFKVRQ